MTDNELILFDRLEVIRKTNEKYDLEHNAYISFSGGKDSTVLHYLMDEALPGNRIPRVFINTGIEYLAIVKFVKEMANADDRFEIVTPGVKIKEMLEKDGYPFKSKYHSKAVDNYLKGGQHWKKYYFGANERGDRNCPEKLKYQFEKQMPFKISQYCCNRMKKEPLHQYQKQNGRKIYINGIMASEEGQRVTAKCVVEARGHINGFQPLAPITKAFEDWYIKERKIQLCELYYAPYNFKRTGCKGCPYAIDLQANLDTLAMYLPNERRQCEFIWAPVYAEYRRLGYRLRKDDGQISLFEWANHVNDI